MGGAGEEAQRAKIYVWYSDIRNPTASCSQLLHIWLPRALLVQVIHGIPLVLCVFIP